MTTDAKRAGVRRPYRRPMTGWWLRNPFFLRYMLREVTAVGVWAYALVLTVGVLRLSQGEQAWNGWLQGLATPASVFGHVVLLLLMLVHAWSWFEIMPKTMAPIVLNGERVAASTIQRSGWIAVVLVSAALWTLIWWWQS